MSRYSDWKADENTKALLWVQNCTAVEGWLSERGVCGCATDIAPLLASALTALRDKRVAFALEPWDRVVTQEEARALVLILLDIAGLAEHGTSVRGSWPTHDGEEWLKDYERETPR